MEEIPSSDEVQRRYAQLLSESRTEAYRRNVKEAAKKLAPLRKSGRLANIRVPLSLALNHRKKIREGDFSVFLIAFAFAIAKDGVLDIIGQIPFVGLLIVLVPSAAISIYLFVFLFGKGTLKWRFFIFILIALDFLPVISLFPMSTFCVFIVYRNAKKEAERSKEALRKLQKQYPGMIA